MTAAIAIGLLAMAAAAFVLAPLFRPDALEQERVARALSDEEDLHARYRMTLAALKDLDDDRSTGKLGAADYEAERADLAARAVDLMKRIDALPGPAPRAERD